MSINTPNLWAAEKYTKHKACDYVRDDEAQSEALRQEFPANNSCGFRLKNGNFPKSPVWKGALLHNSFSVSFAYRYDNNVNITQG